MRAKKTTILGSDKASITRAATIIKEGGLVAFPTETVFGLGADATNKNALNKIFKAKGRPRDNPLIVHIHCLEQLNIFARNVPEEAYKLAHHFWPGPLSLVLQRSENLPDIVSAGLDTVAIRMPSNEIALDLIIQAGVPVAAPSANLSGSPSPTTAMHVLADLTGKVNAIINSSCTIGLESTVLDLTSCQPVILRPGGVSIYQLEAVLGFKVLQVKEVLAETTPMSPGMKYRHYSPKTPLVLITGRKYTRKTVLNNLLKHYRTRGLKTIHLNKFIGNLSRTPLNVDIFARLMYDALRKADHLSGDLILAEQLDENGLGEAIMNRLRKAATRIIRVK